MIKQIRASYSNNKKNAQYCALSTDNLPNYLKNGDEVYFIDTGKSYIYNEQTGELVEGTLSGGGASSLDALSDMSIISPGNNNILLYNFAEEKWENESLGYAVREVTGRNDDTPGVLTIGDARNLFVSTGIFLTGETAASIMALIQAAIANGQYSTEAPASMLGQLFDAVALNTSLNAPIYLNIISSSTDTATLSLMSKDNTSAAWIACVTTLNKIYRVTLHVYLGKAALMGTVSVKAEELMTLNFD